MTQQALLMWNIHAADDAAAPLDQAVDIVAVSYTQVRCHMFPFDH